MGSSYALEDIPVKTPLATSRHGTQGMDLPMHLRPLLVMIDGARSVRQLLALGLRGVDAQAFETLYTLGLIEGGRHAPARFHPSVSQPAAPAAAPALGLSEARFAVIDLLLDLSTRDFAARPWIERMEQTRSLEQLQQLCRAFCASPLGAQHKQLHARILQAVSASG